MHIENTPPIRLSPVDDSRATWRYMEAETPVDFSQVIDGNGWSAELIIENCGSVVYRADVSLTSDGYVEITVPAATGQALRSFRRIDARYQIRFTPPLPDYNMVWQGPITVLEVIA